ncbi:MAG: MASE1 domain-containing protein [Pseudomonadales bacterium]
MAISGNTAATILHDETVAWKAAGFLLTYAIFHAGFVYLGNFFSIGNEEVKSFWPASGLLVGVLLLSTYRTWPALLLAAVVGQILVQSDKALFNSLLALVSVLQAGLVAAIICGFSGGPIRLARPRTALAGFILGAMIGPAIGSLPGAAVIHSAYPTSTYWQIWQSWWMAHFIGILFITPVLLTWYLKPVRQAAPAWEPVVMLAALALVVELAIFTMQPESGRVLSISSGILLLSLIPLFLWAGLRLGTRIVSAASLLVLLLAVGNAKLGLGPFAVVDIAARQTVLELQMFLALIAVSALTLAVASDERLRFREAMARQIKFKEIISHLSTEIINADTTDIDTQIVNALREIGLFADADRCHLIEFDNQKLNLSLTHEWCAPGVKGDLSRYQKLPFEAFPWAIKKIQQRRQITVFDIRELPAAASNLSSHMTSHGIRSLVYVPLVVEEAVLFTPGFAVDAVVGVVGFQWVRNVVRPGSDIAALLHIVGQLFISTLQRKRNLQDLQSRQLKLSSMASELALAEERARRRTAVDLHDGIAQNLAVVRMKLGQLVDPNPFDQQTLIADLQHIIDDTSMATQHIIADLSPPILYELGLLSAIKWLAARFEKQETTSCTVTGAEQVAELGEEARLLLFQAVRELLINISKHAQASAVTIDLCANENEIRITVQDDGIGFNTSQLAQFDPKRGGFGLFSIKERLANLGGTFALNSSPGIGTTVRISCTKQASTSTSSRLAIQQS